MILDSILDQVGKTPLVRADRLAKEYGFKCNLYCKCEFFNAGGSVKDRIAKRMVEQAERDGRIKRGHSVIIEPTSGNTGIGLALQAAVLGYRCIICLPEKMSLEKQTVIEALGAEVIRTPTEAGPEDPRSHIQVANRLAREIPGGIVLDQYVNESNPLAHYEGTAVEIIEDIKATAPATPASPKQRKRSSTIDRLLNMSSRTAGLPTTNTNGHGSNGVEEDGEEDFSARTAGMNVNGHHHADEKNAGVAAAINGTSSSSSSTKDFSPAHSRSASVVRPSSGRVDALVAGAGTGGSISGTSKKLKETWKETKVVGIDPIGSILALPETLNTLKEGQSSMYAVEGIGYDFIPKVLDRDLIDTWIKVGDDASFEMTRKLIRVEGLLAGGSSGCAMAGAIDYLTNDEEGKKLAQTEGANVVVIMPDSIRNYITKPWLLNASASK